MFLLISKNIEKDQTVNFWLGKTLTVLFFEQVLWVHDHGTCWWERPKIRVLPSRHLVSRAGISLGQLFLGRAKW